MINNLNYTIKGKRLYLKDNKEEKVGFVTLVYESGLKIPDSLNEMDAFSDGYAEAEHLIKDYEMAIQYAVNFGGHTVPETAAGFAVCYYDGSCELFLSNYRVGTLLVEDGKTNDGSVNYSLVNSFDRTHVSIKEGDFISSGNGLFKVSGINIYTQKPEMYAGLNWAIEESRDPSIRTQRENGDFRLR